ncbi:hypothetical protein CC86DRAFT_289159, partial [Ophiobolus disseminans]
RHDPRAQKLSQAFHSISVQKSLLTHEAQGLMQALVNERQRRKRGKALPLQAEEDYHSGAKFWSPRKVNEARDRLLQQGLEEEQLQHQRAEAARLREVKKQEKLQAAQQKRAARAAAQMIRQEEKAHKAADQALQQAARRTQQRLQQAQKTAQRGKRRDLKAATKAGSKKRAAAQPQSGDDASDAAAGPPPSQSRHGRAIKLPAKYR